MRVHESITEIISNAGGSVCPHCGWNLGRKKAGESAKRPRKAKYHIIM